MDSAEVHHLKSIYINEKLGDNINLARSYAILSGFYNQNNKNELSIKYGLMGLKLAENTSLFTEKNIAYGNLAIAYSNLKNYKDAFESQVQAYHFKDSIHTQVNTNNMSDIRLKFEIEKRETELKEDAEKQRNKLVLIIALTIFFVIAIGIFFSIKQYQRKLKYERDYALLEQKLLRTQMNPHFIFNCLGSIQSFIAVNKPIVANQYLARLSVIMRRILEGSIEEYTSLKTDINLLQNYLELNKMLLDDQLEYSINTSNIDLEKVQIPSMLIQPFVENAIVHGIKDAEHQKGVIAITYHLKTTTILCTIDNNGKGISQNHKINPERTHKSLALQIVTERLAMLQHIPKQNVNISVTDLMDMRQNIIGTRAVIEIPFRMN